MSQEIKSSDFIKSHLEWQDRVITQIHNQFREVGGGQLLTVLEWQMDANPRLAFDPEIEYLTIDGRSSINNLCCGRGMRKTSLRYLSTSQLIIILEALETGVYQIGQL